MKTLFQDIFEYHHYFNQLIADVLEDSIQQIPDRTIFLLSHCVNAHQIWNSRILGTTPLGVHDEHTTAICKTIDDGNYKSTLEILNDLNLDSIIVYHNSKGFQYSNSIRDILFHVSNHFAHHKGQIISDLRQSGIEPPVTDYIFFKRS